MPWPATQGPSIAHAQRPVSHPDDPSNALGRADLKWPQNNLDDGPALMDAYAFNFEACRLHIYRVGSPISAQHQEQNRQMLGPLREGDAAMDDRHRGETSHPTNPETVG
jgi:hypothetical protein